MSPTIRPMNGTLFTPFGQAPLTIKESGKN
jgi:hypothetical protein